MTKINGFCGAAEAAPLRNNGADFVPRHFCAVPPGLGLLNWLLPSTYVLA
jgi:hypothetical protein